MISKGFSTRPWILKDNGIRGKKNCLKRTNICFEKLPVVIFTKESLIVFDIYKFLSYRFLESTCDRAIQKSNSRVEACTRRRCCEG